MKFLPVLLPELLLFVTLCAFLAADLFVKKKVVLAIALGVVLIVLEVLLIVFYALADLPQMLAFNGHTMFVNDGLALILKIGAVLTSFIILLTSLPFLKSFEYQGEFIVFLCTVTLSILFLCSAADWILIYLSLEFTSIVSYILAGYRRDARSSEAAVKYFLLGAVCSAFMVFGFALLYGITGTTSILELAGKNRSASLVAFLLIFAGFGFKLAAFPFHMWAPDAYEGAPTPITAFFSVGPKIAAFAVLIRVVWAGFAQLGIEWEPFLTVSAIFSMTLGNVIALHQQNIKRLLAYSTIAHIGYVLVGFLSIQQPATDDIGFQSVVAYLFIYLFMNLGLFAAVMAVEEQARTESIAGYAGLSQQNPLLAFFIAVFLLSLTGIPPMAGFVGKFFIFAAAIKAKLYLLALVMGANSVVSAYYYLNVIKQMYLVSPKIERSVLISFPLFVCVLIGFAGTLILGLFPSIFSVFLKKAFLLL